MMKRQEGLEVWEASKIGAEFGSALGSKREGWALVDPLLVGFCFDNTARII